MTLISFYGSSLYSMELVKGPSFLKNVSKSNYSCSASCHFLSLLSGPNLQVPLKKISLEILVKKIWTLGNIK